MSNFLIGHLESERRYNASLASWLSLLLPGLGQIYNGQARKGLLFLATGISYFLVFALMVFNQSLINGLVQFGQSVHMEPDRNLVFVLSELHLGSSLSFILIALFVAFIICAMRDTHEHAHLRQQKYIYADHALQMAEATTGSYLLHFVAIILLFVLAAFFLKTSQPLAHITYIEFVPRQITTNKVVESKFKSNRPSVSSGQHQNLPVRPASNKQANNAVAPVNKVQQPTAHVAAPLPQFHPPLANKLMPLAMPNKVLAKAIPPLPHNVSNANNSSGPPAPKSLNKIVDLPTPSVNKNAATKSIVLPKVTESANLNGQSNNVEPKVANLVGTNKYNPAPINANSQSVNGDSKGNNSAIAPITPTKGSFKLSPNYLATPMINHTMGPTTVGEARGLDENIKGNPLENANTHGPISIPASPVNFGPYMNDLQRRIKRNWFPPKDSMTKQIVVLFKIHQHGELSDLRIDKSSGSSAADQAALKAVENAAPFRPLPAGASESADIQFTFDYNVFSGGTGVFKRF